MNYFLPVKSNYRATSLRLSARIISIIILAFLWPARGEAQAQPTTPPASWTEYAPTAQVGPTEADVSVTDNTHYTVHTSAGLAWIAWVTNEGKNNAAESGKSYPATAGFEGCTVTLGNDISLAAPTTGVANNFDANWLTIGNSDAFKGTFDGGNHTVSDLSITSMNNRPNNGLFGYIEKAVIKNLRVEGKIEESGSISNDICVGGIVGHANDESKIIACSNAVEITVTTTGGGLIGGIVGWGYTSHIHNCWNEASLSATATRLAIGGIAGESTSIIDNCYSSGPVSGRGASASDCESGGIVGKIENMKLSHCYATGSVSATNALNGGPASAGGIAGHTNQTNVSDCLALNTGGVSANGGTSHVDRICGKKERGISFKDNYASTRIKLEKGNEEAAPRSPRSAQTK